MKITSECRYLVTDIVAIPVIKIYKKSEAYRQATKDGWGTVYTTNQDNELICDQDSHAVLSNSYGQLCCIFPYEELKPKEWFKQAECKTIITGDSCGFSFWEDEKGLVKFYITRDEAGFIDSYRLEEGNSKKYDEEEEILWENLPLVNPYDN